MGRVTLRRAGKVELAGVMSSGKSKGKESAKEFLPLFGKKVEF